jgi:hypothetical protein
MRYQPTAMRVRPDKPVAEFDILAGLREIFDP